MRKPIVYLSAAYGARETIAVWTKAFREAGVEVKARWISGNHEGKTSDSDIARFAEEDVEDVTNCDYFVLFHGFEEQSSKGGKWVEMGLALGLDKPMFFVLENWDAAKESNVFVRWLIGNDIGRAFTNVYVCIGCILEDWEDKKRA